VVVACGEHRDLSKGRKRIATRSPLLGEDRMGYYQVSPMIPTVGDHHANVALGLQLAAEVTSDVLHRVAVTRYRIQARNDLFDPNSADESAAILLKQIEYPAAEAISLTPLVAGTSCGSSGGSRSL
jgi:hypothetical protein